MIYVTQIFILSCKKFKRKANLSVVLFSPDNDACFIVLALVAGVSVTNVRFPMSSRTLYICVCMCVCVCVQIYQ